MARYVAGRARNEHAISAHLERRAALDGADFVLNMVQIGGHEATLRDFEIPARYGLRQTIGDTLGIGGIFRDAPHSRAHARAGAGDGRSLPARALAPQLHEPDGGALPARLAGHADDERRRPLPLRPVHGRGALRAGRRARERGHVPRPRASTTRHSSSASSATARISTRGSTRASPPTRNSSGASGWRSIGASVTSRPSRASTQPSTCPGSWGTTRDRPLPHSGRRVHPAQRGEPRRVRAGEGGARARRARSPLERSNEYAGADRALDGDRRAERRSTATSATPA